jgi:hypothetical protein
LPVFLEPFDHFGDYREFPTDISDKGKGNSEQVAHQPEMDGLGMPKSPIFSR